MDGNKDLICIVCPQGCSIKVSMERDRITNMSGNRCKRGADYAASECVNPVRTLTSVVKVPGGSPALVSVRSDKPLPKDLLLDCMQQISKCRLEPPVNIGDVIIENILNTGVNIVATKNIQ